MFSELRRRSPRRGLYSTGCRSTVLSFGRIALARVAKVDLVMSAAWPAALGGDEGVEPFDCRPLLAVRPNVHHLGGAALAPSLQAQPIESLRAAALAANRRHGVVEGGRGDVVGHGHQDAPAPLVGGHVHVEAPVRVREPQRFEGHDGNDHSAGLEPELDRVDDREERRERLLELRRGVLGPLVGSARAVDHEVAQFGEVHHHGFARRVEERLHRLLEVGYRD